MYHHKRIFEAAALVLVGLLPLSHATAAHQKTNQSILTITPEMQKLVDNTLAEKAKAEALQEAKVEADRQAAVAAQQAAEAAKAAQVATQAQTPTVAAVLPSGSHTDWMAAAGINPTDYPYVDFIVSHESGWNPTAQNPSGAYGLCQALPGIKMSTAGADWATNPITQLRWCTSYANNKGGWYHSYLEWVAKGWW